MLGLRRADRQLWKSWRFHVSDKFVIFDLMYVNLIRPDEHFFRKIGHSFIVLVGQFICSHPMGLSFGMGLLPFLRGDGSFLIASV